MLISHMYPLMLVNAQHDAAYVPPQTLACMNISCMIGCNICGSSQTTSISLSSCQACSSRVQASAAFGYTWPWS